MNVYLKRFNVSITIHNPNSISSPPLEVLRWVDLPWEVRKKWGWYFNYRAALAQVQNPKSCIVRHEWKTDAKPIDLILLKKKEIAAAKGQVTKIENLLKQAVDTWDKLFPIEEDTRYQKCIDKYNRKKEKLSKLQNELEQL